MQLLQLDPLIEQVNAELAATSTPGRNILRVSLKERLKLTPTVFGQLQHLCQETHPLIDI